MTGGPLLAVDDLRVEFPVPGGWRRPLGWTRPLDGISLEVGRGEVVGLVGETGCGKTLTGLAVMGLLPASARIAGGTVAFDGVDLLALSEGKLREHRGRRIAMVFQNPTSALNPVFTVGAQIGHVLSTHLGIRGEEAKDRARRGLVDVGLTDTDRVLRSYPHQLSGGMLQRSMIAMALICEPDLLIADEPTTALDVTIGAQILRLLRGLQEERGFSVLFITHDLGVVRRVTDRVVVLYAGRVAERAATGALLDVPRHPYTEGLIAAVPRVANRGGSLPMIPGVVPPNPGAVVGCTFADRCPIAVERCVDERPRLRSLGDDGHDAACHLAEPVER